VRDFLNQFLQGSLSSAILTLSAVIALGVALGSLRFKNLGLGSAGVLFVGIFFGQLGFQIESHVLEFARDFGLLLFVYSIGLQVGSSFFSSLGRRGLRLNLLAVFVVGAGTLIAFGLHLLFMFSPPATAGLLAGATTNTPSLAAAAAAIDLVGSQIRAADQVGVAYAVAYPFGIAGIILSIVVVWKLCRDPNGGVVPDRAGDAPVAIDFEVTNANLEGRKLSTIPILMHEQVVVSRICRGDRVFVPRNDAALALGDRIRIVGPVRHASELETLIGPRSQPIPRSVTGNVTVKRLFVTNAAVAGRTLSELALDEKYEVVATRLSRGDIEFTARENVALHLGDLLVVVGSSEALEAVAQALGNEPKALDHPPLAALFSGILCGVVLGTIPIFLPGLPAPVRLGLAGGPLIVAILASQLGRLGPLNWYLTPGANFALREFGMALFLACVGIKAGHGFLETVFSVHGAIWAAGGIVVTVAPLLLAALIGHKVLRLDRATLVGVLAGSMTDPPALAFASSLEKSDEPLVAYAAVYPLTMVLRVFLAQLLVLSTMH
jgi:putative transport protein